jgi:hypothetical protein
MIARRLAFLRVILRTTPDKKLSFRRVGSQAGTAFKSHGRSEGPLAPITDTNKGHSRLLVKDFLRLGTKAVVAVLMLVSSVTQAQTLCKTWSEQRAGNLEVSIINEASGMAASSLNPDRLYHVNDTWQQNAPVFFITDTAGQNLQTVRLENVTYSPRTIDTESMDVGPCGSASCLFIGDIGDNRGRRAELRIFVIEEFLDVPDSVTPEQIIRVTYPDGARDSESLAVHPNGDIYLLSKEGVSLLGTAPARLYKLPREVWENAGDEVLTLELVATLDLRALSGTSVNVFSHIATGMDISDDGQRLLILTYGEVFEIALDVSQLNGQAISTETPHKQIEVVTLLQQEAISYASEGYSFFYTAEAASGGAPLMLETCVE